jgi:hypothetical protein
MKQYVRHSIQKYPITKLFLKLIAAEIVVAILQYILP